MSARKLEFIILASLLSNITFPATGGYAMEIKSPAFQSGKTIPTKYTCDAEDASPELKWSGTPKDTKSFALISDDPDAPMGTWVHWVIYDLLPTLTGLPEGVPKTEKLQNGAKQGITDFKRVGYGGPCPPPGKPHRYYFKLYALDSMLNLPPNLIKSDLLRAMRSHILAEAELIGTYKRG